MIKLFRTFAVGSLIFLSFGAWAGQSGYVLHGKTTVTHTEGTETQPRPQDSSLQKKNQRNPASIAKIPGSLFFEEDDLARCYWKADSGNIFCIKK